MLNNIQYEHYLYSKGIRLVAGIDEAGRGPLAGPLVVCAVILDLDKIFKINDVSSEIFRTYAQVQDSKVVSANKRSRLYDFLTNDALCYSVIKISNTKIDQLGIGKANSNAFNMAVKKLPQIPQHVLTDFFRVTSISDKLQTNLPKGDKLSITIAAASIIAKVHRDRIMANLHEKYPLYGFDKHKGYGTKQHFETLRKYGTCEIHRKSFEPVKSQRDELRHG